MIGRLTCFLLLFSFFSYHSVAQQTSVERQQVSEKKQALNKAEVVKGLQQDLFSLPYDLEYLSSTLVPETLGQRAQLAPHYPDLSALDRNQDVIDQAFADWILQYPGEYDAYRVYLENFILEHSSN